MTDERTPKQILHYKPKGVEIEETVRRVREDKRGLVVCTINWRRENNRRFLGFLLFVALLIARVILFTVVVRRYITECWFI
jgi:hypothetical protein